eukprot:CAMPEP_0201170138 /NCGR_PEP_ID=MMETSP0851-20130426/83233_1 /ASSEMBLY_ACC=CAM_ASM_000631 /TAXON_ID=183588 /ORGANISM="Pseudo-nitzschia fraudulenta, Strain WWA7" /LENGTH=46 /DNA_ID=CAMNT_0047452111 /DNA_START=134 /DNA_END=271 /DNA_ORIENTATION=+
MQPSSFSAIAVAVSRSFVFFSAIAPSLSSATQEQGDDDNVSADRFP